jgi:DNA end-binding protein Ku
MARRSIWNGAISFGMVVIPVKLYTATDSNDINFVNLHSTCHTRIRQPRYCPYHEQVVESSEIVRAYEYGKEQYIVMEDSDFENVPVPSKHTIEITQFVDLTSIDPIYFERSYALEPQEIGVKPFYLLKQALESTQRVAIAKLSLRQKEHLCCLRPYEDGIMLATMHYPSEIRGVAELTLPEGEVSITKQEMQMAKTLIDQLTDEFDATRYTDQYREALEAIIQNKLGTGQTVAEPAPSPQGKVGDLMEALRASIESTKSERASRAAEEPEESKPKRTRRTRAKKGA